MNSKKTRIALGILMITLAPGAIAGNSNGNSGNPRNITDIIRLPEQAREAH